MAKYGVGIVGTGWVSGEYISAFTTDPRTDVVALCSRDAARARAKAADHGIECDCMDDYEAMAARDDIDIIVVATPPHLHCAQAVAAAKAGKHLVLEKAMATTLDDARAIRDAVGEAGVKSVVSFVLRWNPLFEIIKTQLADGAIGDIILGEVDYFHGIGPWYGLFGWNIKKEIGASSLLSAGCHAMDALRWFMGGEIVEVCQYAARGDAGELAKYEYNPTTVTICKFDDGRIGKVASSIECIQPYVFNINLIGQHGTINNNRIYSNEKFPGQSSWVEVPTIMPDSGDVTHHPFLHEVSHLLDCIENGAESHCNIADAFKTHAVCFAADQSGETGGAVAVPTE